MAQNFKFNRVFGLRLSQRIDETYFSILVFTILIFAALIFVNSQIDYSKFNEKAEKLILHKYKTFVSQLLMEEIQQIDPQVKDIKSVVITAPIEIKTSKRIVKVDLTLEEATLKRETQRREIAKKIASQPRARGILKAPVMAQASADNLPEVDDYFNDIPIIEEEELQERATKVKLNVPPSMKAGVTNFDPGNVDGPPDNLFNYVVRRQGTAYLDVPEQLTKEPPTEMGYRDPEEVERVVHQYSPMIEYCFRKHTKFSANSRGFIKVAFKVSYEGYVIPESVRIVSSTIRNRALEQCIKNYIRHWRNFKPLDESMGIAQVVQKFVFN